METPAQDGAGLPSDRSSDNELITIAGGVELEVTHLDGSKETIKVRQIPVSQIQQFAFAISWGNESAAIELYCDKPKAWTDTLSFESASAIADKGQEINLPFFEAWSRRQAKWKGTIVQSAIEDAAKKLAKASPSASSAPPSPTSTS
jgi:hypothetical protein